MIWNSFGFAVIGVLLKEIRYSNIYTHFFMHTDVKVGIFDMQPKKCALSYACRYFALSSADNTDFGISKTGWKR